MLEDAKSENKTIAFSNQNKRGLRTTESGESSKMEINVLLLGILFALSRLYWPINCQSIRIGE